MVRLRPIEPQGFLLDITDINNPIILEEPIGNTKTALEVISEMKVYTANNPASSLKEPGSVCILGTAVTVPNDALPINLEEMSILLEPNTKYTFRFRVTKYTSGVPLNLSFSVPGDTDQATISWNDTDFNGLTLGDDDESPLDATGTNIASSEVSGIITVNSEGGVFTPQVRQDTVDVTTSEITEAYLEVLENGN